MILFFIALLGQPGYLVYKLIKLTVFGRDDDEQPGADDTEKLIFYWIAGARERMNNLAEQNSTFPFFRTYWPRYSYLPDGGGHYRYTKFWQRIERKLYA
jgi:hypothetical protein